jgi:hypothetical protein
LLDVFGLNKRLTDDFSELLGVETWPEFVFRLAEDDDDEDDEEEEVEEVVNLLSVFMAA